MDAATRVRKLRTWALLLIIVGDSELLNLPSLYYEPFAAWVLVGVPVALLIGFSGSVLGNRLLRIVGWVAVCLFTFAEIVSTIPGEEYTLGGPGSPPGPVPHLLPNDLILRRFVLFSGSAMMLILCYWWAGRSRHESKDSS